MLAHDWDTQRNHGHFLNWWARLSFDFGLRHADLIISQTQDQKKQLKNNFGLESIVIRSLATGLLVSRKTDRRWTLWVGRSDHWKQPEVFIRLAKKQPREKFVMICRQGNDRDFFNKIKSLAEEQTNLKFMTAVSFETITDYFKQAKVLVNTSVAEGFPNTFLQAGLCQTPVVSLQVNPEDFIERFGCGFCAKNSFPRLVALCRRLVKNQKLIATTGNNNLSYVKKFHSATNVRLLTQILLDHFGRSAD
jgi:glycosyltransferase involved in cell wall biosynthesis